MTIESSPPSSISKHTATILDILDRVTYAPVSADDIGNPIYRLRYDAYRREESVPLNDAGVVIDDLDVEPNAQAFGVYIDGKLASSLRLHLLHAGARKSPSMKVHPEALEPLLEKGHSFIDPSRFTADIEASLQFPALPFLTLRLAVMASIHHDATWCLALVRPEHGAFYRRVFGSTELAGPRSYPGLAFPVSLFGALCAKDTERTLQRYQFFRSTPKERSALFERREHVQVRSSSRSAVLHHLDQSRPLEAAE
jgi:hypothetical protein